MGLKRSMDRAAARDAVRRLVKGQGDPALNLARQAYQKAEAVEAKVDDLAGRFARMFPEAFSAFTEGGLWTPPGAKE